MPLPLLIIPIALAGACAAIQAASKIRAHRKLTQLHQELDYAHQQHVQSMQAQYDRQQQLCADLGLPEPDLPDILQPQPEPEEEPGRRLRLPVRLPFRKKEPLLQQAPKGSSALIVGRHGASFAASTVWKTSSGAILRVVEPVGTRAVAFMPKFASFAPKFATAGGSATGSIAASTGLRFALSAFFIVGIVIGPALAAWGVFNEVRKVRKARHEQAETLAQYATDLEAMIRRTEELETQRVTEPRSVLQPT
jgi:hypothetical protein